MNIDTIVKKILSEATTTTGRGSYVSPWVPALKEFEKNVNGPFTNPANSYDDPLLDYDIMDGSWSYNKKTRDKLEKRADKIKKYLKSNPDSFGADDEGGILNAIPKNTFNTKPIKNFDPKKTVTKLSEWTELNKIPLNEDLAVWFGTKKKPKGSKQPKGPWVNICRKVDGKHPPCGRPDASSKSYPKCRAAGVAGKMSDSAKKAACAQKRRAEKKDTQTGKGQKPVMTSYKPKKKRTQNESLEKIIKNILSSL